MLQPVNIRRYLALMLKRGISNDAVLEGTNIRIDRLHDPAYLVDLDQCRSVVDNMVRLTGDPSLGLTFGKAARISDFGIVGHALLSSKTIRQASALWLQYSRSLLDMLVRIKLEDYGADGWSLGILDSTLGSASVYRFCSEELLVFGSHLLHLLTGETACVGHVRVSYGALGQEALYRELFDCEPEFGADRTEIVIKSPGLDQPLRFDPDELSEVCLRHCSKVMRQISDANPIVSRLRSILLRSTGEAPSIGEAARTLDMSERTLRRRLLASNLTYQGLLDDFRCDMATEYFRSGQMKPKEVAYLLGYKSVSTFRRAFKSWTGKTIRDFLATPASSVQGSP